MKVISASVQRVEGKVDLHDISWELAYVARMIKLFSQTTAASASNGLVDSAGRKLRFASDLTDEILAYWSDEELRSSAFVPPPNEAPLDRCGLEESDIAGEGEAEGGMGDARNIRRDMKAREYGLGGRESIRRGKFSTDVNGDGEARVEGTGARGPVLLFPQGILVRLYNVRAQKLNSTNNCATSLNPTCQQPIQPIARMPCQPFSQISAARKQNLLVELFPHSFPLNPLLLTLAAQI